MLRAVLLLVLASLAGPALAQVPVAVRARAAFDEVRARAQGRRVTLEGVLRDDLGRPVPGAPVTAGDQRVRTGIDGRFRAQILAQRDGHLRLAATYAGSALLGPARGEARVTVGRRAVSLAVTPRGEVSAGRPLSWVARLTSGDGTPEPDARLDWRLGDGPWLSGRTDGRGRAVLPHGPLAPGLHTLEVAFAGDADRLPTRWQRGLEATRPMGVTLSRAAGDGVRVVGRVTPGPGVTQVVVTVDGQPLLRRRTGTDGRWAVTLEGLDPGPRRIRAVAETNVPGWADAASDALLITIPTPPPTSPAWLWLPAALGVAALGWLGWRRRPPRRRPSPPSPARPPPAPALRALTPLKAGGSGLSVVLVDAISGAPLAGLIKALDAPHFGLDTQPPGVEAIGQAEAARFEARPPWLWASAPGYAPACLAVAQSGRLEFALLPAAAWVQQRFDALLTKAGRPRLAFGVETPREAAQALAQRGAPAVSLQRLVSGVEAACFAPEVPLDLAEVAGLAATVEGSLST